MVTDPVETDNDQHVRTVFRQRKETGMNMVHRLRHWEEGDTVWGYDTQIEDGSTTGKTFARDSSIIDEDEEFVRVIEERLGEQMELHSSPAVGVVWVGTIESVRTDGGASIEDPEPPLKHASLTDVCVKEVMWSE